MILQIFEQNRIFICNQWIFKTSTFRPLSTNLSVFRIGTCGGIGLPPGTVVVTEEAVDGRVRPVLDTVYKG